MMASGIIREEEKVTQRITGLKHSEQLGAWSLSYSCCRKITEHLLRARCQTKGSEAQGHGYSQHVCEAGISLPAFCDEGMEALRGSGACPRPHGCEVENVSPGRSSLVM